MNDGSLKELYGWHQRACEDVKPMAFRECKFYDENNF
jgi:hypothetical protein